MFILLITLGYYGLLLLHHDAHYVSLNNGNTLEKQKNHLGQVADVLDVVGNVVGNVEAVVVYAYWYHYEFVYMQ